MGADISKPARTENTDHVTGELPVLWIDKTSHL